MNNSEIISLVRNNLVHQQLWTDVDQHELVADQLYVFSGLPPNKLSNDDELLCKEWVIPVELSQYRPGLLTLEVLQSIFDKIKCKRLTLGITNDDGTVVYYFVYKGLHKPKQN
ncbi:LAFE_0H01574g1_1 [Lachancea fermentati]|uniref:LAFE_0H01574g1_1 n=1 Tax=Lachancea fermentati TaxID=4955 RepID=A0A1G4MJ46_LACFM|nr:LAFE_0H01574g1_1 [Lachancea fermentati]